MVVPCDGDDPSCCHQAAYVGSLWPAAPPSPDTRGRVSSPISAEAYGKGKHGRGAVPRTRPLVPFRSTGTGTSDPLRSLGIGSPHGPQSPLAFSLTRPAAVHPSASRPRRAPLTRTTRPLPPPGGHQREDEMPCSGFLIQASEAPVRDPAFPRIGFLKRRNKIGSFAAGLHNAGASVHLLTNAVSYGLPASRRQGDHRSAALVAGHFLLLLAVVQRVQVVHQGRRS